MLFGHIQPSANFCIIKGTLSGLIQLLETESPVKMMENTYFTSKVLLVLKIFKFLS